MLAWLDCPKLALVASSWPGETLNNRICMTRQRKWQIKQKEKVLCIKCSKPAVVFPSKRQKLAASNIL